MSPHVVMLVVALTVLLTVMLTATPIRGHRGNICECCWPARGPTASVVDGELVVMLHILTPSHPLIQPVSLQGLDAPQCFDNIPGQWLVVLLCTVDRSLTEDVGMAGIHHPKRKASFEYILTKNGWGL